MWIDDINFAFPPLTLLENVDKTEGRNEKSIAKANVLVVLRESEKKSPNQSQVYKRLIEFQRWSINQNASSFSSA